MKNLIINSLDQIQKSFRIKQDVMINIDILSPKQVVENHDFTIKELEETFNNSLFFLSFDDSNDLLPLKEASDLNFEISNWMKKEGII